MIVTRQNLSEIKFGEDHLIPVIAQDFASGEVLMVAWANLEAIKETLERNRAVFWSRSRKRLWEKGETSGHTLSVVSLYLDCDRDALLMLVDPHGPACHTGTLTCFSDAPLTKGNAFSFLTRLESVIDQRVTSGDSKSYTSRLVAEGPKRLAQKVGEEGLETALALTAGDNTEALNEAADLLFHLAVALKARGLSLKEVVEELRRRHETR